MKKHTFHNTTNETGEKLQSYEAKAYSQDQQVADFFTCHPGELYTPWEIQNLVFKHPRPPITSVRRSMSNLTRDGILTKTTEKKMVGVYDRASYCWTINQRYYETLMAMDIVFAPEEEGWAQRMSEAVAEDAAEGPNLDDLPADAQEDQPEKGPENEAKNEPSHLHDQYTLDLFAPKGRELK